MYGRYVRTRYLVDKVARIHLCELQVQAGGENTHVSISLVIVKKSAKPRHRPDVLNHYPFYFGLKNDNTKTKPRF